MKKIVLFDMDGTLTESRGNMGCEIERSLALLQKHGFEIGIISGSDMNYIAQQCNILFDLSPVDAHKIHFLPCNGTKYMYNHSLKYDSNMRLNMYSKNWRLLLSFLSSRQSYFAVEKAQAHSLALTGHFISYRDSMINWCPIGRNANSQDREEFVRYDKESDLRKAFLNEIKDFIKSHGMNLTVKLGGDTSFDIFPNGWDKTYPITVKNLFEDYEIYFVGDRCYPNGNDYELYSHEKVKGVKTKSPEETIEIIKQIIGEHP